MGGRIADRVLRVLLATAGGYVLSTLAVIAVVRSVPPVAAAEAVQAGLLLSFLLHAVVAMWVFAAGSAWRACWTVLLPTLLLGAWLWPLGGMGPS